MSSDSRVSGRETAEVRYCAVTIDFRCTDSTLLKPIAFIYRSDIVGPTYAYDPCTDPLYTLQLCVNLLVFCAVRHLTRLSICPSSVCPHVVRVLDAFFGVLDQSIRLPSYDHCR